MVEEGDSLQLVARAITASGDTVPDAQIVWQLLDLDTDSTIVGFTVDSLTGLLVAQSPGSGRVRPRVKDVIPVAPISIEVTAAPDSISADGDQRLAMAPDDTTSPALTTVLYDLTTHPDSGVPLPIKPVIFDLVSPVPGTPASAGFFIVPTVQDSTPQGNPHTLSANTDESGRAHVFIRRSANGVLPDSAVVNAVALTAIGDTVRGSPVRFVVVFANN